MRSTFRGPRRTLVLAVLLAIAAPALFAADAPTALARNPQVAAALEVDHAWADWTARNREQPAVSIGIVYDQELVWARGYGFADLAKKVPATPATAYRIASISKTFTAHSLLQLRDAGQLQLDDPVSKWIPELKLAKVDPQSPAITIRNLLTHTAGIPREVDGGYWNDMNFPSREAMLPVLNRMGVVWAPDKEWKYSNVALSLAGYVVEAASGEKYADYVSSHILAPLGMTGTRVILPGDMPTLAVGYGRRVPGQARRVEPFLNAAYMVPAANLASTVEDLAKYESLQFRTGPAGGAQILKGSTLAEMQRVHWLQPDWKSGWGLGWGVSRRDDKTRIGHGGSGPGAPHADRDHPGREVRRRRADQRRGRAHRRSTRTRPSPSSPPRSRRPPPRRPGPSRRRPIRRGRSTSASTRGRTRRSTSPSSTGSSRCSTPRTTTRGNRK